MRLLIVEDEKQICDAIAKSPYDAGYEVDTCYDGEEALECILTENYDLVVLDLNLPGMDGMEILKELRPKKHFSKLIGMPFRNPGSTYSSKRSSKGTSVPEETDSGVL